jgi:hypothetical protein
MSLYIYYKLIVILFMNYLAIEGIYDLYIIVVFTTIYFVFLKYFYHNDDMPVFLITAFLKSDMENITKS